MADVVSPLLHLETYPTPIHGSDLADHMVANGTVTEGMVLAARDSAARNVVWTDNPILINAPLRMSLIASASNIAGTGAATYFNKTYPLGAGDLNRQGLVLRVTVGGPMTTKAAPVGDLVLVIDITDGTLTPQLVAGYTDTVRGSVGGSLARWALSGGMTVRSTGSSATIRPFGTSVSIPADPAASIMTEFGLGAGGTTLNLTVATTVKVLADWGTADASNSIGLDTFFVEIMRPGATVS